MGKKSKKNTTRKGSGQTQKPSSSSSSSSVPVVKTDTNDEKPSAVTVFPCRHSEKGINIANLKSGLQKGAEFQCLACSRNKGKSKPKTNPRSKGKAKKLPKDDNKSLWVCLACGLVSCGSEGDDKSHSWQHYLYQRHPYALVCDHNDQTSLQGWCFPCQMSFLPDDGDHQIHNQAFSIVRRYLSRETLTDEEHSHYRPHSPLSMPRTSIHECGGGYVARGLVNLGNTCFFNSVLQNLLALDTLRKHFLKPNDTPEGRITSALRKLYAETSNEVSGENELGYKRLGKGSGVLNPKPLFSAVCSKASQFLGYQQQDSHELLRYLVVNLQAEETSCKKGIRDDDSDSKSSSSQEDALVDRVFRGELCSTISCKKCGYSSVVHEPFYDLSLSIPTKLVAKKAPPRPKAGLNTKLRARPKIKNKGVEISERRSSSSKSSSNDVNSGVILSSTATSSRLSISSTAARQGSSDNASEHDFAIVESSVFYGPYLPENVSQKEPSAEPESISWMDYYDSSSCAHDIWELNSLVHGNQPESHDNSSFKLHSFEHGTRPEIHDNSGLEQKSFEHGNQSYLEINTSEQGNQSDSHANSCLEADTFEEGNQLDSHVHTGLEINSIRHGKKPDSDVNSGVEISSIRHGNQPASHVNSGIELNSFENGDRVDAHISCVGSEISCRLPESIEIEDAPLPALGDSEVIMLPYNETSLIGYEGSGDHLGAKESGTIFEAKEDEVELDGIGQLFDGEEDYFAESKGQEEGSSGSFLFDKNNCEDLEQEADCNYPMSVDGCLARFTMTEILSGDNAWRCENCASIARNVCIDLDRTGKGQEEIHEGDELSELGKPKNIEKLPRIDDTSLEIVRLDTNNEEDNYSRLSGIVEETFDVTDRTECNRSEASIIANLIDREKGESSEKSTGSFSSTEVQLSDCDGHQLNGEVSDKENSQNTQTSISHGDKITDSVSLPDFLLQSQFNNYSNEEEGSVVRLQTDKSSSSEILSSPNVEDGLEMSSMESDELQHQRVRQTVKAQRHQRRKAKKNATGIDGENVDKQCNEANGVFQEATKRFLISKAPLILTIHLNRFSQDMRGHTSKLNGHVGFQDILDLRPFLDPRCHEKENCIYQLTGVVEHSGTMRGGHYVAYVRCHQGAFNIDNKSDMSSGNVSWCCVSDAYVRSVTLSEVLQSEAYLLFYERCGKSDTNTTSE